MKRSPSRMLDRLSPGSLLLTLAVGAVVLGGCSSTPQEPQGPQWTILRPTQGAWDLRAVTVDSSNNLWAGAHDGGVSHFDGTQWTYYSLFRGSLDHSVTALEVDRAGRVWCGAKGLAVFEGGTWRTLPELADEYITAIATGDDGSVYVATEKNVGQYSESIGAVAWFPTDGALPLRFCYAMTVDRSGDLWVAHNDSMITRIASSGSVTYGPSDGVPQEAVTSIATDGTGGAWCVAGGALYRFDGSRWNRQPDVIGAASCVAVEHGQTWIGTQLADKVYRFTGSAWQEYSVPIRGNVDAITIDKRGVAWFATGTGAAKLQGN